MSDDTLSEQQKTGKLAQIEKAYINDKDFDLFIVKGWRFIRLLARIGSQDENST